MTKKDDKHALYLVNPETKHVELVHADDVEAKRGQGYTDPDGQKANGEEWNREEDLPGQDAAADFAKKKAAADLKKHDDADKSAERAELKSAKK